MDEPTGVPRSDPFLVLDDEGRALRNTLIDEVKARYRAASDGQDWRMLGFLLQPQVGDLVLEFTRAAWSGDQHHRDIGLGYLLAVVGESWFLQYGPGPDDVCTWEGAMFMRAGTG